MSRHILPSEILLRSEQDGTREQEVSFLAPQLVERAASRGEVLVGKAKCYMQLPRLFSGMLLLRPDSTARGIEI